VDTPLFVIGNQLDSETFASVTCGVSKGDKDYRDFEVGMKKLH
jgi:hypothetical protein